MKTPNLFLLGILLSLSLTSIAQSPEITKGSIIKITAKKAWFDIKQIGGDQNNVYYALYPYSAFMKNTVGTTREMFLARVNKDMEMEQRTQLSLVYEDKDLEYEFGFQLNGEIYVFSSFQNNKIEKTFLFAQSINKSTLRPKGTLIKVAEVDYSEETKYERASFKYEFSNDSSKVLFMHNLLDKKGNLLKFGYTVTDNNLKKIKDLKSFNTKTEGIYNFQFYKISNAGQVYLVTSYFEDKKEHKNSVTFKKQWLLSSKSTLEVSANFDYIILKFTESTAIIKEYSLKLQNKFITSTNMYIKDNGNLVCIGFYSSTDDAIPDGTFFQEIDKGTGKVIKSDTKDLEGKFSRPSKYADNTKKDLNSFRFVLKDIIQRRDGSYVLAAERTTQIEKTVNTQGSISYYSVYHTDDIVIVNIDKSGKISWVQKIVKEQETVDFGYMYSSFALAERNDAIECLFTDLHPKKNKGSFGRLENTQAYLVTVDPSGKQSRKVIFASEEDVVTLRAYNSSFLPNGDIVMYAVNGIRLARFLKLVR